MRQGLSLMLEIRVGAWRNWKWLFTRPVHLHSSLFYLRWILPHTDASCHLPEKKNARRLVTPIKAVSRWCMWSNFYHCTMSVKGPTVRGRDYKTLIRSNFQYCEVDSCFRRAKQRRHADTPPSPKRVHEWLTVRPGRTVRAPVSVWISAWISVVLHGSIWIFNRYPWNHG